MYKQHKGFTVLELLIAISIFSVVSVASVWMIFASLSLRDQALATTRTQEQLRVFSHTLRRAIQGSSGVTGGGNMLQLTSPSSCWSFIFDNNLKNVRYSEITTPGCTPDPIPQNSFFVPTSQVISMDFTIIPLSTGGRQVRVSGVLRTVLPFNNYEIGFSDTYTNIID